MGEEVVRWFGRSALMEEVKDARDKGDDVGFPVIGVLGEQAIEDGRPMRFDSLLEVVKIFKVLGQPIRSLWLSNRAESNPLVLLSLLSVWASCLPLLTWRECRTS
jgi:hypothetical protein